MPDPQRKKARPGRPSETSRERQDALSPELEPSITPATDLDTWRAQVSDVIEQLAATGVPFTADDVRERGVPAPPHRNHWGLLWSGMHRAGVIEPAGIVVSTRLVNRGGVIHMWRGTYAARRGGSR